MSFIFQGKQYGTIHDLVSDIYEQVKVSNRNNPATISVLYDLFDLVFTIPEYKEAIKLYFGREDDRYEESFSKRIYDIVKEKQILHKLLYMYEMIQDA